jgi:hypothetical protein
MNFQEFKQATISQPNRLDSFWTFVTSTSTTISSLKIASSNSSVKIIWSDGSPSDTVTSDQAVSHTYTY